MALPESIREGIAEVAADRTSGAAEVAKHAASLILQFLDSKHDTSPGDLSQQLHEIAGAIVRAQHAMAPMLNLANRILQSLRASDDREQVRALISTYANQLDTSTSRIALHAREVLLPHTRILTHSNSSVVRKTLAGLRQGGWNGKVVCTESRPMQEGVDLARELAGWGLPVTLVTDAGALSLLPSCSALVLGADAVSSRGVVNKIGSFGLALVASHHSIPVYVLCGSEKFVPEELVLIEQRNPGELLSEPVQHLTVHNVYFDLTPLDRVTAIITEEGLFESERVHGLLHELEQSFVLTASDLRR